MTNDFLTIWGNTVLIPLTDIWGRLANFLPSLIGAIIILLIGWVIAVGLDRLITQILRQLRIDVALAKIGSKTLFAKAGFNLDVSDFIGALVRWTILLIAFLAAADILGLSKVTDFLNQILVYIPNVFVAIGILLIGLLAANFFAGLVRGTTGAARVHSAQFLAATTKWVIYIFTVLVALNQLGIAASIIDRLITAIFFLIALAGGLAFGLGGQKAASEMLDEIRKDFGHKK